MADHVRHGQRQLETLGKSRPQPEGRSALITGILLLIVALAFRGATPNRYIRGRLFASALMFAAYAAVEVLVTYARLTPGLRQQLESIAPILVVFGAVNAGVAIAVNPWRTDRVPDRFPNIVQDALAIAVFALIAVLVLQERLVAMTAVGAVVIGFALQDTLGNLFAGLAIQIEKPFRVGQWVQIAGRDGMVTEITWRATKIRTKAGNFVVVPNSLLARDIITNFSEPHLATCLEVDVGASYNTAPNEVKATILEAMGRDPSLAHQQQPQVLIVDFAASAITYRIKVWTNDFAAADSLKDRVRSLVYYAFRRRGITIPYPVQVQIAQDASAGTPARDEPAAQAAIDAVDIFAALSPDDRADLRRAARWVDYAAEEIIVRQGEAGSSMFVLVRGEAKVTLEPDGREVSRVGSGGFFGEMSLLTGETRTATVIAVTDCELIEITADAFRRFVLANPKAVEDVGASTSSRAIELARLRVASPATSSEPPATLVARIRKFLRL